MALLTIDEASKKTRLSRSTLYKATSAQSIPFIKLGARVLFDEGALEGWISSHAVAPVEIDNARA
jgi:DNA binding domain, excisionase family